MAISQPVQLLASRYLGISDHPFDGLEGTFGKPFTINTPLRFPRSNDPNGDVWSRMAYLDPAVTKTRLAPHITRATSINHRTSTAAPVNPPSAVALSYAPTVYGATKLPKPATTVSAVAMRELNPYLPSSNPAYAWGVNSYMRNVPDAWMPGSFWLIEQQQGRDATGGRKRLDDDSSSSEEDDEVTPGPGHYDLSAATSRGPSFTISGRTRSPIPWAPGGESPGPGQYNVKAKAIGEGPAFTMTARPQPAKPRDVSPGPAAYQKSDAKPVGPSYSIAPLVRSPSPPPVPGPGEYNVTGAPTQAHGPAFTLPGRQPPKPIPITPGPADYQKERGVTLKGGPAYSISNRVDAKILDTPAPGDYSIPSAWREGPSYSMAHRRPSEKETARSPSPGPGEYFNPKDTGLKGPAWTLAGKGSPSPPHSRSPSPGPGDYFKPPEFTGPAFSLPKHTRPHVFDELAQSVAHVPGPGAYQGPATRMEGPGFTMSGKLAPEERPRSPGPALYEPQEKSTAPAFTMLGRPPPAEIPGANQPGPADYAVTLDPDGPSFTIGGRHEEKVGDGPGPGDYFSPDLGLDRGRSYTIRGRPVEAPKVLEMPGPGTYMIPQASTGPSFTIAARAASPTAERPASPAPGDYDAPIDIMGISAPAYSIGIRPVEVPRPTSPGPGEYSVAPVPSGPAFTIATKAPPAKVESEALGPGAYSTAAEFPAGPAFTMPGRAAPRDESQKEIRPGPGTYDLTQPTTSPAWTMGAPPRMKAADSDLPGPGDYDVLERVPAGPAYTIAGRAAEPKQEALPGPGQYHGPTPSSAPAFTMGARPDLNPPPDTPGPGDYTRDPAPGGPAYTMAGRHLPLATSDLNIDPNMPGPGEYGVQPADAFKTGPAFSLSGRLPNGAFDHLKTDIPGPGVYAQPLLPSGPAYSITGRAPDVSLPDTPGPGQYTQDKPGTTGPAYTMSPRPQEAPTPDAPGPADYLGKESSPSGPAYSMGATPRGLEPQANMQEGSPGPGEYYNQGEPNGPAYTMAAKPKKKPKWKRKKAATPGPGDYHAPKPQSGPAYSIRARGPGKTPERPHLGPAEHADGGDKIPGGPAYTLRARHAVRKPLTPGPGEYSDARPFPNPLGPVVSYSLHPSPSGRDAPTASHPYGATPGPGEYHEQRGITGPAYSLRARSPARSPVRPHVGPAEYAHQTDPKSGYSYTLVGRHPDPQGPSVPGPGAYIDSRTFPNPLGDSLSYTIHPSPTGREPHPDGHLYGGLRRKVVFAPEVSFRDSTETQEMTARRGSSSAAVGGLARKDYSLVGRQAAAMQSQAEGTPYNVQVSPVARDYPAVRQYTNAGGVAHQDYSPAGRQAAAVQSQMQGGPYNVQVSVVARDYPARQQYMDTGDLAPGGYNPGGRQAPAVHSQVQDSTYTVQVSAVARDYPAVQQYSNVGARAQGDYNPAVRQAAAQLQAESGAYTVEEPRTYMAPRAMPAVQQHGHISHAAVQSAGVDRRVAEYESGAAEVGRQRVPASAGPSPARASSQQGPSRVGRQPDERQKKASRIIAAVSNIHGISRVSQGSAAVNVVREKEPKGAAEGPIRAQAPQGPGRQSPKAPRGAQGPPAPGRHSLSAPRGPEQDWRGEGKLKNGWVYVGDGGVKLRFADEGPSGGGRGGDVHTFTAPPVLSSSSVVMSLQDRYSAGMGLNIIQQ